MPKHAESDEQNRDLWLSMAERWSYLAREAGYGIREVSPFRGATDQHSVS